MIRSNIAYKVIFLVFVLATSAFIFYAYDDSYKLSENPEVKLEPTIPKVTLKSIFEEQNDISSLDENKLVTLLATGDVIPARGANWPAVTSGDFTYNWKKTADFLKSGGITLINLEAPLTKTCLLQTEGMNFCGDARHIQGIVFAGIDSVSLANNHLSNAGRSGTDETITLLEKNNIGWSGFEHLDIQKRKDLAFGFLAFNGVSGPPIDREALAKEIKEAKKKVDVLITSIHWGMEYELVPKLAPGVAPDDPNELGHLMIDSGVDLVIGNHPHWVQGVEIYNNKLITYAHGNFIFDQTWSQETQEGVVGEYTFYEDKLVNVKFHPILVDVSYQPRFLSKKTGQHIIKRMQKSSQLIIPDK